MNGSLTRMKQKPKPENIVLFRREALDALEKYPATEPALGVRWAAFLSVVLVVLAMGTVFMLYLSQTRIVSEVSGTVTRSPATVFVKAPKDGVLATLLKTPGDEVRAGEAILSIDTSSHDNSVRSGERKNLIEKEERQIAALESKRQGEERQYSLEKSRLKNAGAHLAKQIQSAEAQLDALRKVMELTEEKRDAKHRLSIRNVVSQREVADAALEFEHARSSYFEIETDLNGLRRALAENQSEERIAQAKMALLRLDLSFRIEEHNKKLRSLRDPPGLTLSAPVGGVFNMLDVSQGDAVESGQQIFAVIPSDQRITAEFQISPALAHDFKAGLQEKVSVFHEDYRGADLSGGEILSISPLPTEGSDSAYQLIVALNDQARLMPEGMPVVLKVEQLRDHPLWKAFRRW